MTDAKTDTQSRRPLLPTSASELVAVLRKRVREERWLWLVLARHGADPRTIRQRRLACREAERALAEAERLAAPRALNT